MTTERPGSAYRWIALATGIGAGIAIGIAMRLVETSRIAFGPYALYGNGALVVPALLGPLGLFVGWALLLRSRKQAPAGAMALFGLAMAASVGLGYGLLAFGLSALASPLSLIGPGIFIVPTVLLASITVALFASGRVRPSPVVLSLAMVGGILIGAIPPFSYLGGIGTSGIAAGAAVIAGARATPAALVALGAALLLLVLVQAFALPLFLMPVPPER